jgi:1,4-dihydroxy-2-naphthoyl-CoA hydrolase
MTSRGHLSGGDDRSLLAIVNERVGGYARDVGIVFVSAQPDEVIAELEIDERHLQPYGLVHGGVLSGMIETVCSVGAALSVLDENRNAVGLENSTSFLRAARTGLLRATARPLRRGRRSHVWTADVYDGAARLVATGRVRLLILEPGAHAAGSEIRLDDMPV